MLQKLRTSTLVSERFSCSVVAGGRAPAFSRSRTSDKEIPFEDLQAFTEVFSKVKSDYVETVDDKKLIEDAIRGMLSGLDPHSAFLNTSEFSDLKIGTTGQFGGLGIEVGMENGFVKVISPIDDTPASRAGIKASDLIIKLDDKSVKGMTLNEAVKIMRGKPNTDIELTIVREGEPKPLVINITREIIRVKSVKNRMLEPGYGYVRITNFQSRTTTDLLKAISDMQKEEKLKGLVLDLRNNPGGVLNGAVGVSDAFIDDGLIVYTEGRLDDSSHRYGDPGRQPQRRTAGGADQRWFGLGFGNRRRRDPGSQARHHHGHQVLRQGFGADHPGIAQRLRGQADHRALLHPNGRSIQAKGIEPDITQSTLRLSEDEKARETYSERDLDGRLSNPNGDDETAQARTTGQPKSWRKAISSCSKRSTCSRA